MIHARSPVLFLLILVVLAVPALSAEEFIMKVMPSPPAPEADFGPEDAGGWDISVGYGHIRDRQLYDARLNGAVAGILWKGVLGRRFGVTLAPLYGGYFAGAVAGLEAGTWSLGTAGSFGTRVIGRADTSNLVLFGGAGYSLGLDRELRPPGTVDGTPIPNNYDYRGESHLFGFSVGAKVQVRLHRFVKLTPFYLYFGGGGRWKAGASDTLSPLTVSLDGGLGYRDLHLIGLDFNIFGVTARLLLDLFRDDYRMVTVSVDILAAVRGGRQAAADIREGRESGS